MGRLAAIAEDHWREWLPIAYATIEDKAAFFQMLEDEAHEQIDVAVDAAVYAEPPPGETFLEKVARYQWARRNAESQAMRETILADPEPAQAGRDGERE